MAAIMPAPHCLCSFVACFEAINSTFRLALTILGFWYFHVNFRTNFLLSADKQVGVLLRVALTWRAPGAEAPARCDVLRPPSMTTGLLPWPPATFPSSQVNLHFSQHSVVLRTRCCVLWLRFLPFHHLPVINRIAPFVPHLGNLLLESVSMITFGCRY